MLLCVGLILIAYVTIYAILLYDYADPNVLSMSTKFENLEIIISVFLVVQFIAQIL